MPEHADGLLAPVLEGIKTGTASALGDYEAEGEPIPAVGDLSIILDGTGTPRAVLLSASAEAVRAESSGVDPPGHPEWFRT